MNRIDWVERKLAEVGDNHFVIITPLDRANEV